MRHRFLPALVPALMLAALLLPGCSGLATYGEDRVRDLSDVIDVRYGTGFGLGASVQLGEVFQTGLGCATEWYTREWYGRKSVEVRDGLFAYGLIFGFAGDYVRRSGAGGAWEHNGSSSTGTYGALIFNMNSSHNPLKTGDPAWFTQSGGDVPKLEGGRFGGAVYLPFVNAGLYFNMGEAIDFLCGLVTFDLMNDDGYPKFFTPGTVASTPASPPAPAPDSTPPSSP